MNCFFLSFRSSRQSGLRVRTLFEELNTRPSILRSSSCPTIQGKLPKRSLLLPSLLVQDPHFTTTTTTYCSYYCHRYHNYYHLYYFDDLGLPESTLLVLPRVHCEHVLNQTNSRTKASEKERERDFPRNTTANEKRRQIRRNARA